MQGCVSQLRGLTRTCQQVQVSIPLVKCSRTARLPQRRTRVLSIPRAEPVGVVGSDSEEKGSPSSSPDSNNHSAPSISPQLAADAGEAWGSERTEEDWSAGKAFSWKDLDWDVYASQRTRQPAVVATVDTRRAPAPSSKKPSSKAGPSTDAQPTKQPADGPPSSKPAGGRSEGSPTAAEPGPSTSATAATGGTAAAAAASSREAAGEPSSSSERSKGASTSSPQAPAPAAIGSPGGPQPSPADQAFDDSLQPQLWQGGDAAAALGLPALDLLPDMPGTLPALPQMQVEPPRQVVTAAEVAELPGDYSVPSLRERAHLAMRASAAAMESSQRAAAYSAAASSAASRAAEAAEQSAGAAAAVQAALEHAAEDAMAAAMERMNRAVEMVADAESRAAAAAAMATAHQDLSESQAAVAVQAADLPAAPVAAGSESMGHVADIHKVLHTKLFNIGSLLQELAAGVLAAVVGLLAAIQAALSGVGSAVRQALSGALGVLKPF